MANPLSVSEENLVTENITIYPNPAKEILYIKTVEDIKTLEIRSLDGRLIQPNITQINTIHIK